MNQIHILSETIRFKINISALFTTVVVSRILIPCFAFVPSYSHLMTHTPHTHSHSQTSTNTFRKSSPHCYHYLSYNYEHTIHPLRSLVQSWQGSSYDLRNTRKRCLRLGIDTPITLNAILSCTLRMPATATHAESDILSCAVPKDQGKA